MELQRCSHEWKCVVEHSVESLPASPPALKIFNEQIEKHFADEPNCLDACHWLVDCVIGQELPVVTYINLERDQREDGVANRGIGAAYTGHFEMFRADRDTRFKVSLWLFDYVDGDVELGHRHKHGKGDLRCRLSLEWFLRVGGEGEMHKVRFRDFSVYSTGFLEM